MQQKRSKFVLNAPVQTVLIKLTWPMIFGMVGMVVFNLVDTYFVGKLGVPQLAAMGFTLPVVMTISSISIGMGIGAASLISRTIVTQSRKTIQLYAVSALLLGVSVVFGFVVLGQLTIEPLFHLLGANENQLFYIKQYMHIWYWGMIFVVVPMVGNNIIRATGDTLTPGLIMVASALMNVALDPLLIFGWGAVPAMGLKGAAIATVISRSLSFLAMIWLLMVRDKLIALFIPPLSAILSTWKKILYVALPVSIAMLITPISIGFITRLIATFGEEAVAAFGIVSRIEMFGLMVLAALASVLTIFAGQHWGSQRFKRLYKGMNLSSGFSLIWGTVLFVVFLLWARPISSIFSNNDLVVDIAVQYLVMVSFSYGFQGLLMIASSIFNGINKPIHSAMLTIMRMIVLYIPLAYLFSTLWGLKGIFAAAFIANLLVGTGAYVMIRYNIGQRLTTKAS